MRCQWGGLHSALTLKIDHLGGCVIALLNFLLRWQFSSEWIIGKSPFNLYTALRKCGWELVPAFSMCARVIHTQGHGAEWKRRRRRQQNQQGP